MSHDLEATPLLEDHASSCGSIDALVKDGSMGSLSGLIVRPAHVTMTRTTINIIKCFIGAASLELPGALLQGGLAGSLVGLMILCALSYLTLRMLARCGELAGPAPKTYPEIGSLAFGPVGAAMAWGGMIAMTVGVCGSYYIFVTSTISELVIAHCPFFTRANSSYLLLPVFILLSWTPSYKYLAPFSVLGIGALIFSLLAVIGDACTYSSIQSIHSYPAWNWSLYPSFVGNVAFVYLIHSVVLPMRNSMAAPKFCARSLLYATAFVTVLNLGFAVPVYLLYGSNTQGNVIDNMHPGPLKVSVQVALSVDLFFTYALFLFPVCEALENDIFRAVRSWLQRQPAEGFQIQAGQIQMSGTTKAMHWIDTGLGHSVMRKLVRAVLVTTTVGIALAVPKFSLMTALSGGLGNNVMGFILPPLFLTRIKWKQGWWETNGVTGAWKWCEICGQSSIVLGGLALMVLSLQNFASQLPS